MGIRLGKPFNARSFDKLIQYIISSKIHPIQVITGNEDSTAFSFNCKALNSAGAGSAHQGFEIFRKCLFAMTRSSKFEFCRSSNEAFEFSRQVIDYFNFIEYRRINGCDKVLLVSDVLRLYHLLSKYFSRLTYYKPLDFKRPVKYIWLPHHDADYEAFIYRLFNYYNENIPQRVFSQEKEKQVFKLLPNGCTAKLRSSVNYRYFANWGEVQPGSHITILGHGNNLTRPGIIGWKGSKNYPGVILLKAEDVAADLAKYTGRIENLTYEIFSCLSSSRGLTAPSVAETFARTLLDRKITGCVIGHKYTVRIHDNVDKIKRLMVATGLRMLTDISRLELQGSHKLYDIRDGIKVAQGLRLADTEFDIFPLESPRLTLITRQERSICEQVVSAWSGGMVSGTSHFGIMDEISRFSAKSDDFKH
ncbi:hypothetical protein P0136_01060 [Lentisphaerota bacterium ZTH]|nr:hypothetical protein JYG24_07800 [Lentisphaerota bacterium]WET06602.1 hypothetical protein P0136_01060 [Lentisphaerota bacterium ZTH]